MPSRLPSRRNCQGRSAGCGWMSHRRGISRICHHGCGSCGQPLKPQVEGGARLSMTCRRNGDDGVDERGRREFRMGPVPTGVDKRGGLSTSAPSLSTSIHRDMHSLGMTVLKSPAGGSCRCGEPGPAGMGTTGASGGREPAARPAARKEGGRAGGVAGEWSGRGLVAAERSRAGRWGATGATSRIQGRTVPVRTQVVSKGRAGCPQACPHTVYEECSPLAGYRLSSDRLLRAAEVPLVCPV